jgi:C1q domain.
MPYIGTSPSSAATATSLTDADDNTKIQVEESSDENIIRFDVAGSEAMRINADGSVNMVIQPSFHGAADGQTNIAYNAYQTLTLNAEDHDVGSDLDLSNETFTCPVDGVYMFVLQINWLNTQTGYNYYHTALAVNSGYEHISFVEGKYYWCSNVLHTNRN